MPVRLIKITIAQYSMGSSFLLTIAVSLRIMPNVYVRPVSQASCTTKMPYIPIAKQNGPPNIKKISMGVVGKEGLGFNLAISKLISCLRHQPTSKLLSDWKADRERTLLRVQVCSQGYFEWMVK